MSEISDATTAMTSLLNLYGTTRDEMVDLLGGAANGGPNGDGMYPVTLPNGTKVLRPSMAKVAAKTAIVTIVAGADNSVAINAALNDPNVVTVQLPPGNISVDRVIYVPTGKWLRGAGMGVTKIVRKNNVGSAAYLDKSLITIKDANGAMVSDLTVVAPVSNQKVQGVWALNSKFCVVENVEAYNCGYSFWAQEFSQFCIFRNVHSHNANVHFETTRAFDILFEHTYATDGDGTNPLGVEATWHCLFGSKRIVFRHGRHKGKGQPFLIVADSGTGDEGFIDDITFEDCQTQTMDDKISLFITKLNGAVGAVRLIDCNRKGQGIPAQIQCGQVFMRNGVWESFSQENIIVYSTNGASLTWENPRLKVMAPADAYGSFFSGGGPVLVVGGQLETTTGIIDNGTATYGGNTRIIRAGFQGKIYSPSKGLPVRYVYGVDLVQEDHQTLGQSVASEGRLQVEMKANVTYRVTVRGRMKKKSDGDRLVGLRMDGVGGLLLDAMVRLQTSPTTFETFAVGEYGKLTTYTDMDSASFFFDALIYGNGGTLTVGTPSVIVSKGTVVTLEQL